VSALLQISSDKEFSKQSLGPTRQRICLWVFLAKMFLGIIEYGEMDKGEIIITKFKNDNLLLLGLHRVTCFCCSSITASLLHVIETNKWLQRQRSADEI